MAWILNSAVAWLQDEKNDHSFAKPSGWARNSLLRGKSLILIAAKPFDYSGILFNSRLSGPTRNEHLLVFCDEVARRAEQRSARD